MTITSDEKFRAMTKSTLLRMWFCFNKIHYCLSKLLYIKDQGYYSGTVLPWHSATVVQCYRGTVLLWYSATVVQCYRGAVLPWCSATVVQCYRGAVLPWYSATCNVLPYDASSSISAAWLKKMCYDCHEPI